jgi:hypothetical protein
VCSCPAMSTPKDPLVWEALEETYDYPVQPPPNGSTHRAQVDGGWLYAKRDGTPDNGHIFVPRVSAELYNVYREYLKHEDGLINWRNTWNLGIQGFLLTAYGALLGSILTGTDKIAFFNFDSYQFAVFLVRLGFPYIGLLLGLLSFTGIYAAQQSIQNLCETWAKIDTRKRFPDLAGGGSVRAQSVGRWASPGPMLVVCLVWSTVIVKNWKDSELLSFGLVIVIALLSAILLWPWLAPKVRKWGDHHLRRQPKAGH